MNDLSKYFGKMVDITVESKDFSLIGTKKYNGLLLPQFNSEEESFISKDKCKIYDIISEKEDVLNTDDIKDINTIKQSKERKEIISTIYKSFKELFKIKKQEFLLNKKKEENLDLLKSNLEKIRGIEGIMDYYDFISEVEKQLYEKKSNARFETSEYGYKNLYIKDYKVSIFGGEDSDYDGIYLIKLEKEIDIEKYASNQDFPFIYSNEDYYGCSYGIDTNDTSYKKLLNKYEKNNIVPNIKNINAKIEQTSYFHLGDKNWLSYIHDINIIFRETMDPKKENIEKVIEIF